MHSLLGHSAKTDKSKTFGYENYILYMTPGGDICPFASKDCLLLCLNTSGRGAMNSVQAARLHKRWLFKNDKEQFELMLIKELDRLQGMTQRKDKKIAVRLNGTSDIPFAQMTRGFGPLVWGGLQFVDYTKNFKTWSDWFPHRYGTFKNYDLTFSYSGHNLEECRHVLQSGGKIAVAAKGPGSGALLTQMFGKYPQIDGDAHDLRFLDPKNCMVVLSPKGKAKKYSGPFVVGS